MKKLRKDRELNKPTVLRFKCNSPFFEQTRDGKKPFDIRMWDDADPRFKKLKRWKGRNFPLRPPWIIELVHPSGEVHRRELLYWYKIVLGAEWTGWILMELGEVY